MYAFNSFSRFFVPLLTAAALFAGAVQFLCNFIPEDRPTSPLSAVPSRQSGKTEDDRQHFAEMLGIEIAEIPESEREITVPKVFDGIYARYNELQRLQGTDLSHLGGKKCTLYTYEVKNHPQRDAEVRMNIIVYRGKIVGGDICSLGLNAFQTSLLSMQNEPAPRLAGASAPPVSM